MALSPVMIELRATTTEFMAKMKEARAEVAKLSTEGNAHLAKFQSFGKAAALGVAAGVAVIGVESIKMAGEFQQSTSVLQTAAGETTAGLKIVRQGILDIARETGTTWQMLSEGMYQVEKAGYRGADGLKILRAAAQGAKEENANLGTVTNAMTSVMASFNIPADKSVQVMNALKTAAAGTKDTMENYAASLSTVLPIASAAHLSFAQVGGALAALTQHGTRAHEATQELAFTIRNLIAPNMVATNTMAQFGISATDVTQKLGQRGVTGTLQMLIQTVAEHTKGGLVQIDTMRKSAAATDDLNRMMQAMSPAARAMATDLMNNTITVKDYRKEIGHLDPSQAAMGRQFATLELKSKGFSDAVKAGQPAQATMESLLKKMTGGAVGLNTALMLSGSSTAYANKMTREIGASMNDTAKEVEGWHQTQNLLNVRMERFRQTIDAAAIQLGTALIPVVTAAVDWLGKHKVVVEVLAVSIGVVLVAAITAWVAGLVVATAQSVASFAVMMASGAAWVAEQLLAFSVVASTWAYATAQMLATGAAWVAGMIAQSATWLATSTAHGVAWLAGHTARLAVFLVEQVAAGATWVATWAAKAAVMIAQSAASGVVWLAQNAARLATFVAANTIAALESYAPWVLQFNRMLASSIATGAAWIASNTARLAIFVASNVAAGATWVATWVANWAAVLTGSSAAGAGWLATNTARLSAFVASNVAAAATWLSGWVAKMATFVAANVAAAATWLATWVAQFAVMLARSVAAGVAWLASNAAQLAVFIAKNVAAAAVYLATWLVTNAAMLASAVATGLGITIAMGPILLIIAAVGLAAYELYKHWDQVWAWIKAAVAAAVGFVKDHLMIFAAALGPIGVAAALLYKNWDTIWSGIKSVISSAWSFIKPIIDMISGALSSVGGAISNVQGALSSVGGAADSFLGGAGKLLGLGHNAAGTNNWAGGPTWVGEKGPEIVNLPRGSQVIPNDKAMAGPDMSEIADLLRQVHSAIRALPREQQMLARTA